MAIRTTGSGAALRVLTKNEGGVRRVSCSCCCFCRNLDLDLLLYGAGIGGARYDEYASLLREDCGNRAAFNALRPNDNFREFHACLRWLCRETVLVNNQPVNISTQFGGPTTNNRDLNNLVIECLGEQAGRLGLANGLSMPNEEYGICYLYVFEFYGWFRDRSGPNDTAPTWVSSDFIFDLYRRDEPFEITS